MRPSGIDIPRNASRRARRSVSRAADGAPARSSRTPAATAPPQSARTSRAARFKPSTVASGSVPRSKRCEASVCIPRERAVRRTAPGWKCALSRRMRVVLSEIAVARPPMTPASATGFSASAITRCCGVSVRVDAVERDERLPRLRAPHDDRREAVGPLRERVEVEGVERLADVPEDVVRRVDGRRDRRLADRRESRRDGAGRRPDRHALEDAGGIARAQRGLGDDDRGARFDRRPRLRHGDRRLRVDERTAHRDRRLACEAAVVHAVRAVRRDLDVVDGRAALALDSFDDEADGRQAIAELLRIRRRARQVRGEPRVRELHVMPTRGRGTARRSRRRGAGPARRRGGTRCGRCPSRTRSPSTSRGRCRRSGARSGEPCPLP